MKQYAPVPLSQIGRRRAEVESRVRRRRWYFAARVAVLWLVVAAVGFWFPKLAVAAIGIVVCYAIAWLCWISYIDKRTGAAGEAHLAYSNCPNCLQLIGAEAARLARYGVSARRHFEHLPLDTKVDLFGSWIVDCPHCAAQLLYDPGSHELRFARREA